MRTFVNTSTGLKFTITNDKAEWFENEKDFSEVFPEPKEVEIKPAVKSVKAKKAKIIKK
jgi:hypothetical protein